MKLLVIVDVQKDFVDGALGTKEAVEMVPVLLEKVRNFDGKIVFTMDTHFDDYMQTLEGKNLPVPHCIKNTEGWKIIPELQDAVKDRDCSIFEKITFGSVDLARYVRDLDPEEVEIVGLCTDICVISNALMIKAFCPHIPIKCDSKCCAGVTVEKHLAALETMRSCQIEVY
ncbi:MAG: cysteine hydrolase [Erysipelotrichaceae bacterium]|nr:cysteine hydrolase [Erysipelotrichaceae bacterium]